MSIKTIDQGIRSNTKGLEKRINKGAEKMVFDILQSTQYSTPIPSTIRELVTNACDSQREKEVAIEILTGEKQEADYYIRRDGEQYADSNFDPTYYELNHLDTEFNEVVIKYYRNEGVGFCDKIEIIDHGVGIGGRRLEGVLELGYSTKRNTSQNFGAFGLGAKVALSTGIDFYTIETVHNGKRFKCNCYPYKTDFMISKFNPSITFSDGTEVHYEPTEEKNYTVISFGVKKHNRARFEESIQDQLNYLGNVKYYTVEDGEERERHIQSEIVHNSKHIIVSDSFVYSKPHIVIVKEEGADTGINYGYVDFRELEMEQLWGSVGLKCPIRQAIKDPETGEEIVIQDGVEVTPSREKVIWNEHTKKFIQGVIESAAEEATTLVEDELQDTDFFKWVKSCRDVLSKSAVSGSNTALRQISKIIDTSKMNPKYSADKSVKFQGPKSLLRGFSPRKVTEYTKAGKIHLSTDKMETWGDINFEAIYFRDEDTSRSRIKDHYLLDEHGGNFMLITKSKLEALEGKRNDLSLPQEDRDQYQKEYNKVISYRNKVDKYIHASELVQSYADVEVPEDWIENFQNREEIVEKSDAITGLSPAERREIEQRIVAFTLRYNHRSQWNDIKPFVWDKVEPKLATVMASDNITYYGTNADAEKLYMAAAVLFNQVPHSGKVTNVPYYFTHDRMNSDPMFYFDQLPVRFTSWSSTIKLNDGFTCKTPQLLRVSEKNVKYISRNPNCKHIDEFFCTWDEESNKLTMDSSLIKYLTGKAIGSTPNWVKNLHHINPDYAVMFNTLEEYSNAYYSHRSDSEDAKEIVDMIERIKEFQIFSESVDDPELVANKSKELFILEDVKAAQAFDTEILRLSKMRDELMEGINPFMECLTVGHNPSPEFIKELTHYLKSRGKLDIEIPLPQNV